MVYGRQVAQEVGVDAGKEQISTRAQKTSSRKAPYAKAELDEGSEEW